MISFVSSAGYKKDAAVILVEEEQLTEEQLSLSNPGLEKEIYALSKSGKFKAGGCEIFPFVWNKTTVVLLGLGARKDQSLTDLRIGIRTAILCPYVKRAKEIELIPHKKTPETIQAMIEAVAMGGYSWQKYITKPKGCRDVSIESKKFIIASRKDEIYERCIKICRGVTFARDLINENADIINSKYVEKTVRDLLKGQRNASLEILNRDALEKKGLRLHLAVNKGSKNEPKLIIVRYKGGSANQPFVALVGKGITFDTGGLNLKPTGSIETMRIDMSGAAAVLGTLKNTIDLKIKKNIIFAVALAENTIDANSYKPGDVVRGYSGKTVEVGNTDAEGRLVLADANAYIAKNYKPEAVINIATLTGACVVALGHDYAGLMSNNDRLAKELLASANATDDRAWRLPIYKEVAQHLKSQVADLRNIGLPRGAAGTISAGEFLRQFVGETKWAHLDIAGTAFAEGQGRMYFGHGATGSGVRLLTDFLINHK